MKMLATIALFAATAAASAQTYPVPAGPGGSCANGWLRSGSYCVPSQGAPEAIALPPGSACPWGWLRSGSQCLRSGSGR